MSEAPNRELHDVLRAVDYLAPLDDDALAELVAHARRAHYGDGERIVSELETGADVFVLVHGSADIVVEPRRGERKLLRSIGPGCAFGEMSSITGGLRSATVIATSACELLVIRDAAFDRLRARRPEVALVLLRTLGKRLAEADRAVDELLAVPTTDRPDVAHRPSLPAISNVSSVGSIRRAWRTLVVEHRRDLAFLTLAAFVVTLVAVRLAVYVSFRLDIAPRGTLRAAYMTGFTLLLVSAASGILTFRLGVRRLVAIAYGVGVALIFNELGVTLAFDIFFKDIHTPDPDVAFDVERLYRRTEPIRAIAIALVVLIQAAYLRQFYRRAWFIARTRLARLVR
jgi:CRP-like cAMP-binding protein